MECPPCKPEQAVGEEILKTHVCSQEAFSKPASEHTRKSPGPQALSPGASSRQTHGLSLLGGRVFTRFLQGSHLLDALWSLLCQTLQIGCV